MEAQGLTVGSVLIWRDSEGAHFQLQRWCLEFLDICEPNIQHVKFGTTNLDSHLAPEERADSSGT